MPKQDNSIDYVELRCHDMAATQGFYAEAFGWSFTDYGPGYAAINGAGLDGGFEVVAAPQDTPPPAPRALTVIYAADLEAARRNVLAAGALVNIEIFPFPGGRRFHFVDPSGNELAVWSDK